MLPDNGKEPDREDISCTVHDVLIVGMKGRRRKVRNPQARSGRCLLGRVPWEQSAVLTRLGAQNRGTESGREPARVRRRGRADVGGFT